MRELIDPLPDLRAYIADKVFHAVALRQMFAYGNVLYQNFPDPTRGVEVPTTMPPLNKIESPPREVLQYVNDHVSDTFGFMPYLILYTGLRRGEALGLRYEDCYDDVIHVSRTIVFESADSVNGMTEVEDHTKTAAGMREVPIFPQVAPYLSQKKSGYIIGGKEMPITRSEFNDGWHRYQRRCADACGGYHLRTHQLRHAFATACYNNGIDAKVCASWMGHKSIATTLNIYTTLGKEKQMEQAKKMKDFFESFLTIFDLQNPALSCIILYYSVSQNTAQSWLSSITTPYFCIMRFILTRKLQVQIEHWQN